MSQKHEWKVGDVFTCSCGHEICHNKIYVVERIENTYLLADRLAFSPSYCNPVSPKTSTEPEVVKFSIDPATIRKMHPVATGVLDYFPKALMEVAHCSYVGNGQHNPGEQLQWDRSKSTDEADALLRHFMDRGKVDTDGVRHSAKVAWRALALLQKELEAAEAGK